MIQGQPCCVRILGLCSPGLRRVKPQLQLPMSPVSGTRLFWRQGVCVCVRDGETERRRDRPSCVMVGAYTRFCLFVFERLHVQKFSAHISILKCSADRKMPEALAKVWL